MSGRTELAEWLEEKLPDTFLVVDHDAAMTITKPTVLTYTETVEAGSPFGRRLYTVIAIVTIPKQTGGEADLEDALEEVLEAVDLHELWMWTKAEWATYNDAFPAYKITVPVGTARVYTPDPEPDPEEEEDES